jgi:putative ATPase
MNKAPLPERVRPQSFDNYIGQKHLVGQEALLRKLVESKSLPSIIFWGPPGTGKTTLSLLIAKAYGREFFSLSAVNSGVKDIREIIDRVSERSLFKTAAPILFIDEIHRFSKSQQDSLLGAVEKGVIILIGATTENPSFEVIGPLLSRCQVFILNSLSTEEIIELVNNAIACDEYLKQKNIVVQEWEALIKFGGGDSRRTLNYLEMVVSAVDGNEVIVTNELVQKVLDKNIPIYDKKGEHHYNIISAFIKSLRGSDPNAAVFWMARMIDAGEDALFIARRMLILASEDIGNANPTAMVMATNCFLALEKVGMPEGRIILSQTAIYLASSPKSNASYMAIEMALEQAKKEQAAPVPLHLRNAVTGLMKNLNYGKEYKYSHQFELGDENGNQEFLPDNLVGTKFYEPGNNSKEIELRKYLKFIWKEKYEY